MGAINPNAVREQTFFNTVLEGVGKKALEIGQRADEMLDAQKAANESNIDDAASFIIKLDKKGGTEKNRPLTQAQKKEADGEKLILPPEKIKDQAESFQKNNPQFQSKALLDALTALPSKIRDCKTPKEIVDIVKGTFGRYAPDLQKKVFDFLEATTQGSLQALVRLAKLSLAAGEPDEIEKKTPPSETLTDVNGEPLNSVTVAEQYLKKFSSIADIKKDLDQIQHGIGVKIKKHEAVEALLINLGKEGQVTQDTRALLNIAGVINAKIEKQCLMKDIVPPNISAEELIKCMLSILAHPRINGEKILSMAHKLVGAY